MSILNDVKNEVEGTLQKAQGEMKYRTGDHLGGVKDKMVGTIKSTTARMSRKSKEYRSRPNDWR